MTRLKVFSLCLVCLSFLAACSSSTPETAPLSPAEESGAVSSPTVPAASEEPLFTPAEIQPTVSLEPKLSADSLPTVDVAPLFTADLMKALGTELQLRLEDIRLVSVEQVDWPNSCMGVEREGVMCMDVITPGYLLVFETTSGTYEVHTNLDGTHFLIVSQSKLFTTPPTQGDG